MNGLVSQSWMQQLSGLAGSSLGYTSIRDHRPPKVRLTEELTALTAQRDALNIRIVDIEETIAELEAQPGVTRLLDKLISILGF